MTTLILNVLRSPDHVTVSQRVARGGELTIGRSEDCDWTLRDPGRSLSRRHCTFEFRSGSWQLLDLSANGTFLNAASDPIGRGLGQAVRHGDRLSMGDYDIEIQIEAEGTVSAPPPAFGAATVGMFEPPVRPGGFGAARLPGLDDGPADYNPFGRDIDIDAVVPDNAPSTASAYVAPAPAQAVQPAQQLVPDDWFHDLVPNPPPPPPAPAPLRPASAPGPGAVTPAASPSLPALGGLPGPSGDGLNDVPREAPRSLAPLRSAAQTDGLQALLDGSALDAELVARAAADPAATLRNAGALLRVAVSGIRKLLVSRGAVKREFRIEQTILQTRENNPLKFAASDEQALAALLDPRTSALKAVQESIDDLSVHQVAVLAATQVAARALLEQLAPDKLLAADPGGGLFPGAAEKRLWEAYKQRHATLLAQFEDDFESAFGKAFAKAYEQAVSRGED